MEQILMLIMGPLVASFVTWFFAMRKTAAEANSTELNNTTKIITMWRELSLGMESRFKLEVAELRKENYDLEKKVKDVVEENAALLRKMRDLEDENSKLTIQLTIFNKTNPAIALIPEAAQ